MTALAPRLRHRVTFQEQVSTRDSDGALSVSWQTAEIDSDTELENVPAEVLMGAGREFNASGQVQGELAARITCRWFPGLKDSWRILWDDRIYDIGTFEADPTGRREWRIRCTSGVNDGQ